MITNIALLAAAVLIALLVLRFGFPSRYAEFLRRILRRLCRLGTRSIDVGAETWRYLEGGPKTAEALVMVHGFGGDKDNWTLYARRFTRAYRVVIPDLPGFGESTHEPDADYSIAAQTERLAAFVRALGIDRFHIAGNSMGGAIALRFALDYPERLLSLALLNNAGVIGENKSELELAAERGESPLTVSTPEEFDGLIEFISHRPLFMPGILKTELCAELIRRRAFLERVFWSLYEELHSEAVNDRLHAVAVPTLIVWGRHDRLIDVSCAELMAARIPDNDCVVFEDMGHVPMLEGPAETAAVHLEHLEQHRAA